FEARVYNGPGGRLVAERAVALAEPLTNLGTVLLGPHTLTLAGGTHTNAGTISAAGGLLRLEGAAAMLGPGALPTVLAAGGVSTVEAGTIEGDVATTGSGGLLLSRAVHVRGALTLGGSEAVTAAAALRVDGDVAIDGGGALLLRDTTSVGGSLLLRGPGSVVREAPALAPGPVQVGADVVIDGPG